MAIQLTRSLLNARTEEEDFDPLSSLANLADVMLVFACGLMMAVVVAWNVDTSQMTEISEEEKLSEVDNIEQMEQELSATAGNSYVDMGTVYMDPATGKYYMVVGNNVDAARSTTGQDATGATETLSEEGGATDATPLASGDSEDTASPERATNS